MSIDPYAINAEINNALASVHKADERKAASEYAMIETAKNISEINGKVQAIEAGLSSEQEQREAADKDNLRYVRKMDKINLTIAIISGIIGVAGVVVALIALFV